MHILTIPESGGTVGAVTLPKGQYLAEDHNAAHFMLVTPEARMEPWGSFPGPWKHRRLDHNPKPDWLSILLISPIGFGDSILLTPCLRAIKQLHPKATLTIATLQEFRQVLLGLPYVDGFEDYPTPMERLVQYDCVLFLERALEHNPKARVQHMTDRFAEHLGLGELKDKRAEYNVSSAERDWVFASFPRSKKRRIAVQVQAGARCRSYPGMTILVEALRRTEWEVYLMGRPGEFRTDGPQRPEVVDLSRRGLTWRQSAATLLTCDIFLGPDSSLLHAAGALDVPAVGLFGPFPWKLRTAYYKSVHAIQGHEGCDIAPCFWSEHLGTPPLPPEGPCFPVGRCIVMESILPKHILAKINQIAPNAQR